MVTKQSLLDSHAENHVEAGHKKTGHFHMQPYRRAAGEARWPRKGRNCFTGLDQVTGCPHGLSKSFWVTQQELLYPVNSELQEQWSHPRLPSILSPSSLPPNPKEKHSDEYHESAVAQGHEM